MLLLFSSGYPLNSLGSVVLDLDTVQVDLDATVGATHTLETSLSSYLELTVDLTAGARQSEQPIPRRHYIWVYDIHGVKTDVIS